MNVINLEPVMGAIRARTDNVPPSIRIHHLTGMAELATVMADNGMRFPAILHGFLLAEAERIPSGRQSDKVMLLRLLTLMEDSPGFEDLARDEDALVWLVHFARLPEYARYVVACRLGDDRLPELILAELRKYDDRAAVTFSHCLLKLSREALVSLSVANALNEFNALPEASQTLLLDIRAGYPRTFHILVSEPPPGEESFN